MSNATALRSENDTPEPSAPRWLDPGIGAGFFVLSLIVYLVTLSAGPYPGLSATRIVEVLGLFPRMLPSHPLWFAVARFIAWLPLGTVAFRLNLFSALCAAGTVWLLYDLMRTGVQRVVEPYSINTSRVPLISRVAGAVAALYLAFCVPFWMVATRAHPMAFDLLLLLALLRLLLHWLRGQHPATGCILLFAAGVVSLEFATAIFLVPALCLVMPVVLWRNQKAPPATLGLMLLALAAGLSFYLLAPAFFVGSDGYVLRGYEGYGQLLRVFLRQHISLLTSGLPREGWLIVLFITVAPWITALTVGRRALNAERDWSYYLLHLIMTTLGLLAVSNAKIAPWPMTQAQSEMGHGLLVTPYLLAASLLGYLVAYWFLLPRAWWERAEHRAVLWLRVWLGPLLAAPLAALALVMPFFNATAANGKQARFVNTYAEATLDALQNRSWVLTDGTVDNPLLIAASDRGQPLELINAPASRSELYMRYVASRFDSARMKNLARIGLSPLLREWVSREPDITRILAVQALADLWVGEDLTPLPHFLVFLGVADDAAIDAEALFAEHVAFWDRLIPILQSADPSATALQHMRRHFIRHAARVANNLGVWLEDQDKPDRAFEAYARARTIDPTNISALLNQFAMVNAGRRSRDAEAVRRDVRQLVKDLKEKDRKFHIWSLSRYYGYVRLPQAFAHLGWTWAYSGQPSLAIAGIRKAMDLLPEAGQAGMKKTLAALYLSRRDMNASAALYREMLDEDPDDLNALFGLCRVAIADGRPKEALAHLRRARAAGADRTRLARELAAVLILSGKTDRARILVNDLTELAPEQPGAWALLLAILLQDGSREELEECIERMKQAGADRSVVFPLAKAHLALMDGALNEARSHFDRVLALNPNHVHALQMRLLIDVRQGREQEAAAHAQRLLSFDPDNVLANRIRGSMQLREGNLMLAEDSFRRAVEAERSADALNDLAWVLQRREQYADAERLVREALTEQPQRASALDTLGVILMKTGRLREARDVLEQALDIAAGNPSVQLHLAQLYARQDDRESLARMLDALVGVQERLRPQERKTLQQLRESYEPDAS